MSASISLSTANEFEEMIRKDEFLEHADVFGNLYGTARKFLHEAERAGHDLLLDIDVQGAEQIKRKLPDAVSIFIMPPDRQTLERPSAQSQSGCGRGNSAPVGHGHS